MSAPTETIHELAGLHAAVTGSSSGIGRAIALELARAGAEVLIHCRQSRQKAEEATEAARQIAGRAELIVADLRERGQRDQLLEEAWGRMGRVEIWVNNAGADILTGPAAKLPYLDKLAALLAVDVTATVHLGHEVARRMKSAGGGVILNMAWDQALIGMEGESGELFAAAKGAVMAFTKSLALSFAPEVRANCLAPGWIQTTWGQKASEAWHKRVLHETPLGRWGTPEDVAKVARFLASPAAAFVTGQIVAINGGAVR